MLTSYSHARAHTVLLSVQSFKLARLSRFKAGEIILDGQASHRTLMLLVEGLAAYRVTAMQAPKAGGSLQDTAGHPVAPALSQKVMLCGGLPAPRRRW